MGSLLTRLVRTSSFVGHTAAATIDYTKLGHLARGIDRKPVDTDMTGKTVVVTGATSGLGEAAAHTLASLGARVIVVSRTPAKVEATVAEIGGDARGEVADLSLLEETRLLAMRLLRDEERIDVLINNAGLLLPERTTTAEGLETSVATNVVSHFLLTNLLIPRLVESTPARIINVSSGGMYTQPLDVDKMLDAGDPWNGAVAYARAKRAQVVLAEMWAEQLAGTGVVAHAMHPGWADTPGVAAGIPGFQKVVGAILRTPDQGADTIVWLAAADEPAQSSGRFWHDRKPRPTHRALMGTEERPGARDRLWEVLADLTGTGARPFS
jgi:NAD(P)-dependent dehydrogenase (short-subunit alcohol dehydrogenase family)